MYRRLIAASAAVLVGLIGAVVVAAPATAAVPDRWGFAYLDNPTPPGGYIPDLSRQWGGWKAAFPGQWASVIPLALGRYRVRFPMTASGNGVAHVTAISNAPRWCQIADVLPAGADQFVDVQCYRQGGAPDWSRFAVMYSTSSGPLVPPVGAYAYVLGAPGGGLIHSYNSAGSVNQVIQSGVGQYQVTLPSIGTGLLDGQLQVTAHEPGAPRRCKVAGWGPSGGGYVADVRCFDAANALADTRFHLTYHRERAVFGGFGPPGRFAYLWTPALGGPSDFNSAGAVNNVIVSGAGLRMVIFPQVGAAETHVQVTAFGGNPDYCGLQSVWQLSGPDVFVRNVICFNAFTGVPTGNDFFVSYTSRV